MSRIAKIEFPEFYGDDPTGWVYRCNQFFKVDDIMSEDKVKLASMHLYDKALAWHQQFTKSHGEIIDWNVYVEALLNRFSSCYEDPMSDLKNIRQQEGLVQVYIDAFDMIMTKVDVPESQAVSFFLGGLDKEIEMTKINKPLVSTTKLVYNNYGRNSRSQAQNVQYTPPRPKPVYNSVPYKKQLTQKELDEKGAKNQCFYSDQKYVTGHKCSGRLFSLEIVEEGEGVKEELGEQSNEGVFGFEDNSPENVVVDHSSCNTEIEATTQPHISLNAISGFFRPYHNKANGCSVKESYPLQVAVPAGNFLIRCEMVLGVQWLATLGDIGKQLGAKLFSMAVCVYPSSGLQAELMSTGITNELTNVHPLLHPLLHKYEGVFVVPSSFPPHRKHDHKIPLQVNTTPINIRPYRHPPIQKDAIEAMVAELLENEVIRESHSPFSSPIIMVKKKDEDLIDEFYGAQVFTKLDLRSGYHQIRMCEEDIHKTAFTTHQGHYEFLVMPFGLTNAPSSFRALINEVFTPFLRKFVLVFFDDILVFNKDMEEHVEHLALVLNTMQSQQLFAKMSKCVFGTGQVEYLGHVISGKGVSTDPSKVKAMQEWLVPVNIKKLRGFLGLTGYYRKFIKGYAEISKALTALLKKNSFEWSDAAQQDFEDLKVVMLSAPVLALPNFQEEFTVETDASDEGIGAVLQQQGHPVAFLSKSLAPRHKGISTYEKELWAVVYALKRLTTLFQIKWLPKLLGYDYKIVYKKESENIIDDALSRSPTTALQTMIMAELLKYYRNEPLGGHSGVEATYKRLKSVFYWRGMKRSVKEHVRTDISIDFIESLPSSHGKTVILVVVDRSLRAREDDISLLQFHLERAQHRIKTFADKNRRPTTTVIPLPHCNKEGLTTAIPVAVLDRRIAKVRNATVVYWLVQWSNGNADDATWEVASELQAKFSEFDVDSCGQE
ncbi:putative mitochondrial protein [Tanacetum coccineum]